MRAKTGWVALWLVAAMYASGQSLRQQAYAWKNVQIVGGGFVDGIVFAPKTPGLRYARTDIGGAYRWDESAQRWRALMDWVPDTDWNLMGVASIAVDPSDENRVYLACGMYTGPDAPNAALLRSADRGRSFQRTALPFPLGGNEDGRGNGESLAVDPHDGRILYLGTPGDGLWRSLDRGRHWTRVASFSRAVFSRSMESMQAAPAGTHAQGRAFGIAFVAFGPMAARSQQTVSTPAIYVGVSRRGAPNLLVSHDGGATWNAIPGEPTDDRPTRAALARDGFLYVAYGSAPGPSHMRNGALWKFDIRSGAWTQITPERPVAGSKEFGYAAVTVDARYPQTVMVSSFGRPASEGGDDIFRSTDGGATWRPIFTGRGGGVFDYRLAPYVQRTPIHWLFDVEIDPTNSNHAVFTTGYGGWETFDLGDSDRGLPTHWSILAKGIEETVALTLDSPPRGAHLISGIGDYGGFVHWNLDQPAPEGSSAPPRLGNTTSVASASLQPAVVVRVGVAAGHADGANLGYSLDSGRTWAPTPASPAPDSRAGSVAVSADGAVWIWTPEGERPFVTGDRGATWMPVRGLPRGTRTVADPAAAHVFYAVSLQTRTLYTSLDSGRSFTGQPFVLPGEVSSSRAMHGFDHRSGANRLYLAPGRRGALWLTTTDGLFRASVRAPHSGAVVFARLPQVERVRAFGFGKAAPHGLSPTLYLAGTVAGRDGIFRSTDAARTWTRINDSKHQWGLILQITGDPRLFGRVYVGTHGRGILYGDPARP